MKRQVFRLGTVLKYYVLQKQRTELELHEASRLLREAEAEIHELGNRISAVAALLHGASGAGLTTTGFLACYRSAEKLERGLGVVRTRRQRQAEAVAQLEKQRKRWTQAEETLLALRRALDENNETEAAKARQFLLDETVLRNWLEETGK
jgi:RNase P/RNase MRP subunit POP5